MIKKNKRTKNLVFISLLLCYILISLFEPFGIVKARPPEVVIILLPLKDNTPKAAKYRTSGP